MDYGAFVELLHVHPHSEGLVHVSKLRPERVGHPRDVLDRNQRVKVKVTQIVNGKISLSMRDVDQVTGEDISQQLPSSNPYARPDRDIPRSGGDGGDGGGTRGPPPPNVRRKRMSSWERFEYQQLVNSGVLSAEDQKRYAEQYENLNEENDVTVDNKGRLKAEEAVDVVVNEKVAPFLANSEMGAHLEGDEESTDEVAKIIKKPQGSLARAALVQASMLQERKELRNRQRREEQAALPSGALTSFDDPMPEGGVHLLASEVRAMTDSVAVSRQERHQLLLRQQQQQQSSSSPSAGGKDGMGMSMGAGRVPTNVQKRPVQSISEQRRSLPVYERREQLLQGIRDNTVLVVEGETGSGKTTQMTQYIVEAGLHGGKMVGCTQPRRVAAISVARRVADEVGCRVGEEVGYCVRFDDKTSHRTKIKYMTDGMLMREYLTDGMLSKYSVLILDEAHERTLYTDVLFALLKELIKKRRDLKLVITSATLDVMKFSQYYGK